MRVLKFGGSSLSTPSTVRQVQRIVLDARRDEAITVVVSAFAGVTNQLLECAKLAERRAQTFEESFDALARRHRSAVTSLVGRGQTKARRHVDELLAELRSTLQGIHLLRHCPLRALDMTASFGERLSALIVAAASEPPISIAVRRRARCLVTDDQFTRANVVFPKTNRRTRAAIRAPRSPSPGAVIPVVTGFIGATDDGQTTTIGRNGSDYSAAIVGAAVGASVIEIWTDVDGVLSADPRTVPSAFVLPHMTYEEAMELSYFGAKVLHSATIAPAVARQHPDPDQEHVQPAGARDAHLRPGRARWHAGEGHHLRRRARAADAARPGMVGVPGVAERLFRTLASRGVNVDPDFAGFLGAHDLLRVRSGRRRARCRRDPAGIPVRVARPVR